MAYTETTWKRWNNKGQKLLVAYRLGDKVHEELARVCDKLSDHRRWIGKGDEELRQAMRESFDQHYASRRIALDVERERLGCPRRRELSGTESAYEAELRLMRR
jgi:hypothetical protein